MVNHFQRLHLPVRLTLDHNQLEQHHDTALALVHPDQFIGMPDALKKAAQQQAEGINEAYQTLKNEATRVAHWFELKGLDPSTYQQDSAQLMQQWDYREKMAAHALPLKTIEQDLNQAFQTLLTAAESDSPPQTLLAAQAQWLFFRRCWLSAKDETQ